MPGISINIIRVGSDRFTSSDELEISRAISFIRSTYATVGLSVPRVEDFSISTADARGRDVIDNDAEASALTDEWTVPNNALDVFFVKTYVGSTAGLSRVAGPCDKDALGMDGSVVEILTGITGHILAHEVGHYLGLAHRPGDSNNLMFNSVPNGGRLDASQGATMRSHCFVEP
jgi:hypothetical protein